MKRLLAVTLAILSCSVLFAQKRISADVEIKQLQSGKVFTITKSVYCANNGRLVVSYHTPWEYIHITNPLGESKYYFADRNQVMTDSSGSSTSLDELLVAFLFGRMEDMGLGLLGYSAVKTELLEDGMLKKSFVVKSDPNQPKVEIVYKDYLPIYSESIDAGGRTVSKLYLSKYVNVGALPFPSRTTSISYGAKADSVVTRTLYSNFKVDGLDPMYDYTIPQDAKAVPFKDAFGIK